MSTATAPSKPTPLAPIPENVPAEMRELRQWVLWRYEERDGGKWTKEPYKASGSHAASNRRQTWVSFNAAKAAYEKGRFDGIGFVFTADGPHVGVDLDHCIDADGNLEAWAAEIVEKFGTYTEVTPSGHGLHLLCRGTLETEKTGRKKGGVEVFHREKYFTVTGRRWAAVPNGIADCTEQLAELLASITEPAQAKNQVPSRNLNVTHDDEIIERCRASKSGVKFSRLWSGDTSDHAGDDSAADLALCNMLAFWCGPDEQSIDRLFRRSGLMRDKWEREDYRAATIDKALSGCREFYRWNGHSSRRPKPELGTVPTRTIGIDRAEGQTDNANADRVLAAHYDSLLFVEVRKCWYVFDGCRHREDRGCATALAKQHAKDLWPVLASVAPDLEGNPLANAIKFVKSSNNGAAVASVERLMRADPRVRIAEHDLSRVFDREPYLLNCLNGTIDLRTGELLAHDRRHRLTKLAPVKFDPDAGCPLWREFLRWATCGRQDLHDFLQRGLGSALWGEVRDHVLLIFYGTGRNGKGVTLAVARFILGDYAMEAAKDLLIEKKHESHATERAALFGKRLVTCTESARRARLDESLVKALTGGDTISARGMRENEWNFRPSHQLVLVTNHRPRISGSDDGIWSRIKIVPFDARISDADIDTGLAAKLEAEAPGILNWLVAGCRLWQDDGFKLVDPQSVAEATAEYRETSDLLKPFLDECTIEQQGGSVLVAELRAAYLAWCQTNGIVQPLGERSFGDDLDARGFPSKRGGKGVRSRLGIALRKSDVVT